MQLRPVAEPVTAGIAAEAWQGRHKTIEHMHERQKNLTLKLTLDLLSVLNFCHVSSNLFLDTGPSVLPCRSQSASINCHAGDTLSHAPMSASTMPQQVIHVIDLVALLQACMHFPTLSSYSHSLLDSLSASLDLSLGPFCALCLASSCLVSDAFAWRLLVLAILDPSKGFCGDLQIEPR